MSRVSEMTIDYQQFIALLNAEFPDSLAHIDKVHGRRLLHVEMGLFLRATEAAMDTGKFWLAEKHFRFIEQAWVMPTGRYRMLLRYRTLKIWRSGNTRHNVTR
jgi:hypothetical protein